MNQDCELNHYYRYKYVDVIRNNIRIKSKDFRLFNPEDYYDLYDSYHISAPIDSMSINQRRKYEQLFGIIPNSVEKSSDEKERDYRKMFSGK